ncbi:MAG: MerR family DNA-binding protein, partial [Acidimicrobiales bacterium]
GQRVGVNPKTIRYYEQIGLLPEPTRLPSGYRSYAGEDAARLVFIKTAQRLGITLDEIREILALRDGGRRPCGYVRGVLRREVAELDQRIRELRRLRGELVRLDALAAAMAEEAGDAGEAICPLIQGGRNHVRQAPVSG